VTPHDEKKKRLWVDQATEEIGRNDVEVVG
jgi:hypothetical protein